MFYYRLCGYEINIYDRLDKIMLNYLSVWNVWIES